MRWRLRFSQPEARRCEDLERRFHLWRGGTRLGVNLPGIHPFEIIATVADANAGPENCHLSTRTMNDRNPKFPVELSFTKTAVSILPSPLKSPSR